MALFSAFYLHSISLFALWWGCNNLEGSSAVILEASSMHFTEPVEYNNKDFEPSSVL